MQQSSLTLEEIIQSTTKNVYLFLERKSEQALAPSLIRNKVSYLYENTEYSNLLSLSPILYWVKKEELKNDTDFLAGFNLLSIFISESDFGDITKHFKCCLTAYLPNQTQSIFRFYSPKITKILLSSPHFEEERIKMFGPFQQIYIAMPQTYGFERVHQRKSTKEILTKSQWIKISQPLFDQIEESYYDILLKEIAVDIYLSAPYKILFHPKERIIKAIDQSFKMVPSTESLATKKKFIVARFKYASHYFLLPEFIKAREEYSLEYALKKLSYNKKWQQQCLEKFDEPDWVLDKENQIITSG